MKQQKQQPIFYPGSGVVFRTVYDIRVWDGRTVGTAKVGHGARMVVQQAGSRWDVLSSASVAETGGQDLDTRRRRRKGA